MENVNEQVTTEVVENEVVQEVVEQVETTETVEKVKDQFPTDDMLLALGVTRDEFNAKLEAHKQLTTEEKSAKLDELIAENKRLQAEQAEIRLNNELSMKNLTPFKSVFSVFENAESTVEDKIKALEVATNELLLQHSYVPTETAKQDAYDAAIQKGDVQGALKTKFAKLFGN